MSQEKDELGRFIKGIKPWNKGKTNVYSKETLKSMSDAKKGIHFFPQNEFKKGHVPWTKGKKGILKPNKTSFKKGRVLSKEIEEKRLKNLREKILLKPNLNISEDLSYILGVIYGDGCVYKTNRTYNIILDVTNKKFAESFYTSLKKIGLNPKVSEKMPNNGIGKLKKYIVIARSSNFGIWYKTLTISKLKELINEEKLMIGFIRGFYESEGHFSKSINKNYEIKTIAMSNTNFELINFVKYLTEKLKFSFNLNGPYKNNSFNGYVSKPIYRIQTSIKPQIESFRKIINPCIKMEGDYNSRF